ncbi:uncharacterized protein [Rutidosis leptorrhynchoides]|uniref:uncharacterized protein n=1 Tax=Rutidosis leptorrhynchoides TaxID=125765 RepID=UPI003A9A47FB
MAEGILILDREQLKVLSDIVYRQEVLAIQNIQFKSENERVKYLYDCKSNHETVLNLLDDAANLEDQFKADEVKSKIAHEIVEYVKICSNLAIQTVRNYTVRIEYLKKIKISSKDLGDKLENLSENDVDAARELAEEAAINRNAALQFARKNQSPASRAFSRHLKESGVTFEELVARYKNRRFPNQPFEELEESQQFEVYQDIIEASGRGRILANRAAMALGVGGIAVLLFTAGMMVWDIFSLEHPIQTAVRDAVTTAASIEGAVLGEIVGTAVANMAGANAIFATLAGIATGFVGAFIVGSFVGWLLDLIFGSGGRKTLSTDDHVAYVAIMPDGQALARQIAHG